MLRLEYENADLRDVKAQQDKLALFDQRLAEIRDRDRRKVSLLDRFARAGLG